MAVHLALDLVLKHAVGLDDDLGEVLRDQVIASSMTLFIRRSSLPRLLTGSTKLALNELVEPGAVQTSSRSER